MKKKLLCMLLLCALLTALTPAAYADALPTLTHTLSSDGSTSITAQPGDIITLSYAIRSEEELLLRGAQNMIYYDDTFFALADGGITAAQPSFQVSEQVYSGGRHYIYFSTYTERLLPKGEMLIGTVSLRVIAFGGSSTLASEECLVLRSATERYGARLENLTVTVPREINTSAGSGRGGAAQTAALGNEKTVPVLTDGFAVSIGTLRAADLRAAAQDGALRISLGMSGIDTVNLSDGNLSALTEAQLSSVTLSLQGLSAALDAEALSALRSAADGKTVRLKLYQGERAETLLYPAQKAAIAALSSPLTLALMLSSDSGAIRDLGGGTVTLTLPCDTEGARVWRITDTGQAEELPAVLRDGSITLTLLQPCICAVGVPQVRDYAECAGGGFCPLCGFPDLDPALWYHDGIHYCVQHGLMRGAAEGGFLPDAAVTRATAVTLLYRLEGSPAAPTSAAFRDVSVGSWYFDAVQWAAEHGIVTGWDGLFAPDGTLTREQLAAILYRYAAYRRYDTAAQGSLASYRDGTQVSDYAAQALRWAVGQRILSGADGCLLPRSGAARAQLAVIMQRFCEAYGNEGM